MRGLSHLDLMRTSEDLYWLLQIEWCLRQIDVSGFEVVWISELLLQV